MDGGHRSSRSDGSPREVRHSSASLAPQPSCPPPAVTRALCEAPPPPPTTLRYPAMQL
ncbi:hypothetical protein HYPSUDRAFT_41178 [Hypholoma sublateritium FD-334 SS-4]|uniref:Uncharacterized protein n=1 Tax=Hypholoma sublateritium (strain FD-334 SS-4) TaxID=945553 RepID=A0A0D2P0Q7_HYPSF|nr:hypothetical protein HYPSUDRAFT_41178 [Hypholoma sublateritium FD-334 SS-4]